jgi:2-amino-4-hydroxy-6-hydroxymethyldihydropteridine diphosphokinase
MSNVYLSIGTNLGNKEQNLVNAIAKIGSGIGIVRKVSEFHKSEPIGFQSDNQFLNAALLVVTNLEPLVLLQKLQNLELELGRTEKSTDTYSDRIIDIDILLYDDIIIDLPELKIPHPKMMERDFVLIPLREIAPDLSIF